MFRHCKDMQAGEQLNPLSRESLSHCLPLGEGGGEGGGESKRRMTFQTM